MICIMTRTQKKVTSILLQKMEFEEIFVMRVKIIWKKQHEN